MVNRTLETRIKSYQYFNTQRRRPRHNWFGSARRENENITIEGDSIVSISDHADRPRFRLFNEKLIPIEGGRMSR